VQAFAVSRGKSKSDEIPDEHGDDAVPSAAALWISWQQVLKSFSSVVLSFGSGAVNDKSICLSVCC
jgi:hypothetical protein